MSRQTLSIAVGVNDRTLPLLARLVDIEDLEPDFVTAPLEGTFARAFDEQSFDVTELSFSNYLYLTATDQRPYIDLPIFPSRSFRHLAIYFRTDRGIQGPVTSREHAALCPQYLGLRLVLVKSFARIHEQNLINACVLPLSFDQSDHYASLSAGDVLEVNGIHDALRNDTSLIVNIRAKGLEIPARFQMSERQREIFSTGGLINWFQARAN